LPLYGIETEYGILVEGKGPTELVAESRGLVNAYGGTYAAPWFYRGEDPRSDMRGFHVSRLTHDPEDAKFDDPSAPTLPAEQERADHVLTNGARLYNDHGHPEYSTPECSKLLDLVAHDRAGERIVSGCARAYQKATGAQVEIYKNNTDFHGSSYGCHENYLMSRRRAFGEILVGLLPFLVTRIIYTGAGKVGTEPRGKGGVYQLSQRADFFTEEASVDTLHRRPIVNTRDEPHADPLKWRRLHVIAGDANMSEFATALKVGTLALVTELLDLGWSPRARLPQPVKAVQAISRDPGYRWEVPVDGGKTSTAIEIQHEYLGAACAELAGKSPDTDWVLDQWEATLHALATNPMSLADRLDWAAKRSLIDDYLVAEDEMWDDYRLQSLDMAYANIDPEEGLFAALEQDGHMIRLTTDAAIESAQSTPPTDTRAAIRGMLVSRFASQVGNVGWARVVLRTDTESFIADLQDYLTPESVSAALPKIAGAQSIEELAGAFGI